MPLISSKIALFSLVFSPLAGAQLLVPIGQDRHVGAEALADSSGTVISDTDTDAATNFGPFIAAVHAQVDQSGLSEGGGSQNSFLLPDSFVGSGSSFATANSTCDSWNHLAEGASEAAIDFQLAQETSFHIWGQLEGHGLGFGAWQLSDDQGLFIDGFSTVQDGISPIDSSGVLPIGSYRIAFRAVSGAASSGCDLSSASAAYDLHFDLVEAPSTFCSGAPNSFGAGARLDFDGSQAISSNDFELLASAAVPGQLGLFYYGATQAQQPFGDGFRCIGGPLFRLNPPQLIDASGSLTTRVDFTSPPAGSGAGQILPDSSWNFQLWYYDPAGPGGSGFNLSDALSVHFLP